MISIIGLYIRKRYLTFLCSLEFLEMQRQLANAMTSSRIVAVMAT